MTQISPKHFYALKLSLTVCSLYIILTCKPHTIIIYYEWSMKMRQPIYMLSFIFSHNTQCTWPDIQLKLELTVNFSFY